MDQITPKPLHEVLRCAKCTDTDGPFVHHTFGPDGTLCESCAARAGRPPWLSVDEIERMFADARTDGARTLAFLHLARRALGDAMQEAELAEVADLDAHADAMFQEVEAIAEYVSRITNAPEPAASEGTMTR